jgi:TonB family protein
MMVHLRRTIMSSSVQQFVATWLFVIGSFQPARFHSGEVVVQPPMAGGGQVLLELDVSASGEVARVTVLRSTPPFTDLLRKAAGGWRFTAAREARGEPEALAAVDSKVLVAGSFRTPTLYNAPALGEAPKDVALPSAEVPFPESMVAPLYPPTAHLHLGQTVLVEVDVGEDGRVTSSKAARGAAGLDAAALDAARQWRFRPARREGTAIPSVAYIVFGFREPVAPSTERN